MQSDFNSTANLSEAEQALKDWGIAYTRRADGYLFVPGDLSISEKGLTRLPDLTRVIVEKHFACSQNQLTSLEGAPQSVGGDFSCYSNQLTSLAGAPKAIGGNFSCSSNRLTSLEGGPEVVGCGGYYCYGNPLTSLEHAPEEFTTLKSDFGEVHSPAAVPENLRISPETVARREQTARHIDAGLPLMQDISVHKPYRFKQSHTFAAFA